MSAAVSLNPIIKSQRLDAVPSDTIQSFLVGATTLSGQELIDCLLQEPKLNELYQLSAGVNEGYSVEEHTRMVVESFEKEFLPRPEIQKVLRSAGLTPQQMILFLTIHDIGKGLAVQKISGEAPERKELQLFHTQEVINEFAKKWNLGIETHIFIQLLRDNAIADFLKMRNPSDANVKNILEAIRLAAGDCRSAGHYNLRDIDFLELKMVFHQVDAASYPYLRYKYFQTDANQTIQLGKSQPLPWYLNYSVDNLRKMSRLQVEFDANTQFKSSVFDYSIAEIARLEEKRKIIKDLEGKEGENYKEFKAELNKIREVNFPFRIYAGWKRLEMGGLLIGGKRYYRESKESRAEMKAELLKQARFSPEMESKLRFLSRLTFIHGSNSATLAMMACSEGEPRLRCFGELVADGIVPMNGELAVGIDIASNGANLRNISVETVRAISRVHHYTKSFSFDPSKFTIFENPLLPLTQEFGSKISSDKFVAKLQMWRKESREEFDTFLAPGSLKTNQLVEVLGKAIKEVEEEISECSWKEEEGRKNIALLQNLIGMLRGELEWEDPSESCNYETLKSIIINPYEQKKLTGKGTWSDLTLKAKQLKQWDFSAFQRNVLEPSEQWMQAIEQEKRTQEKPIKMLIDIIDRTFNAEEETFLKTFLIQEEHSTLMTMPDSLSSIFPTLEDIPYCFSDPNFSVEAVEKDMGYYRGGAYSWNELLNRVLVAKLQLAEGKYQRLAPLFKPYNTQEHLDQLKPIFENQLPYIERGYNQVREALTSTALPRIQIPKDEEFRSLITKPFPVIFASTMIKPKPSESRANPREYLLGEAVPLNREGCDILFTDTEESKEKIYRLMPQLQERVDIRMISELDLPKYKGNEFPLNTAPSQLQVNF